ncbi:AAA family ATPase [Micromonospora lupini]|uniref:AAA family ATPase n=1 Tax=Micromonospora lupini TaxID=285679 RepID=UPI0033D2847F
MRLTKIEFNGYKRLRHTKCNVDGKLIAFVGPNEAGKSSILTALTWLLQDGYLEPRARSWGGDIADETEVVRAIFSLAAEDLDAIKHLECVNPPRTFIVSRTAGGRLLRTFPEEIEFSGPPTADAVRAATQLRDLLQRDDLSSDDSAILLRNGLTETIDRLRTLSSRERELNRASIADMIKLAEDALPANTAGPNIHSSQSANILKQRKNAASGLVRELSMLEARLKVDPSEQLTTILWHRSPDFVLFSENDRNLEATYDLGNESLRKVPPAALRNLLEVGNTSVKEIWDFISKKNRAGLRTLLNRANRKIDIHFADSWRQQKLKVHVDIDGTTLEIFVEEADGDGAFSSLSERSDGLRTFVALSCFLTVSPTGFPPILLIDEAETHLHIDAQADLINVLETQELAEQVIYTTHSPACLPTDLGTGIRFVEPAPNTPESTLRSNFWDSNIPGYSPMLFAMGASAAAFALCRRAVLCEGPTEMILLPKMIRLATELKRLEYQVVPGLSVSRLEELAPEDIAGRVAYLVDGDQGGRALRTKLIGSGVSERRVLQLPEHCAVEDFVTEAAYLRSVNHILSDSGHGGPHPSASEIAGDGTISKRVSDWFKKNGLRPPGKTIVASHLVRTISRETLAPGSVEALTKLHSNIMALLDPKGGR